MPTRIEQKFAVIFDIDGVLVDSYQPHLLSWQRTAQSRGLAFTPEIFAKTFGRISRDIIRDLWPGRFSEPQILAFDAEKEAAYRRIISDNLPEMPGASDLIRSLHAAGFSLAVGSSGSPENVSLVLDKLPAGSLFHARVTGAEVQFGKPNPQVFLLAAEKLNIPPARCIVIEDAPAGLQAARRAGMTPIALASGTAPPPILAQSAHLVVHSLSELTPSLLTNLLLPQPATRLR